MARLSPKEPDTSSETVNDGLANPKSIIDLVKQLGVVGSRWHVLAAVDGSGSIVNRPIGYGSVIAHKSPYKVATLVGSAAFGGVQEAEVRAVLDLCSYLLRNRPAAFESGYYVHVMTDSSYVHSMLSDMEPTRLVKAKAHPHLWQGIAQLSRRGIFITPHLLPRNTNLLMTKADELSKLARKTIEVLLAANVVTSIPALVKTEIPITHAVRE